MGLLMDDKGVIHIPKPMPTEVLEADMESFSLKTFQVQICNYGAYWRSHSHSFNLFIEFILKGER